MTPQSVEPPVVQSHIFFGPSDVQTVTITGDLIWPEGVVVVENSIRVPAPAPRSPEMPSEQTRVQATRIERGEAATKEQVSSSGNDLPPAFSPVPPEAVNTSPIHEKGGGQFDPILPKFVSDGLSTLQKRTKSYLSKLAAAKEEIAEAMTSGRSKPLVANHTD